MAFQLRMLPPSMDLETKPVLKQLAIARAELAMLNGRSATIPNETILINTLSLQEARDSSAIENIVTTHDELYKAQLFTDYFNNAAAKEVSLYAEALKQGFALVRRQKLINNSTVLTVQRLLEGNEAGYRQVPGTALVNEQTGETVYTPPQSRKEIEAGMDNLVAFMNDDALSDLDPLVKMAVMHHQFETIHPFYDGNGRTGRILNILYLVQQGLLDLPVLYLSRYLIATKADYYRLLQSVRDTGEWQPWLLYMLKGVEVTAKQTVVLIEGIRRLMQDYKQQLRTGLPKIYSQDLLNNLFRHPYTKIEFVIAELQVSRPTATAYLEALVGAGLLQKFKLGKSNYYMNNQLYNLLREGAGPISKAEPIVTQHEAKRGKK
ncbi:MAG: Fic family protein [Chitinophagaceae bacterium]|nr:MAG: Fic family protein [Chitinophagaceae bacterium]